jgi:NOL1/NOP2/sun family putative RNA methylase
VALTELERFRPLIDDWSAFVAAVNRPEPTTLRVNSLRCDSDELAARLRAQGFDVEPVEGLPDHLRVLDGPRNVADTFEHWAGLVYIQQASTGVVTPLLGARPGERVLDLCAAPGGKTTHLAELMAGHGPLIAADVNDGRLRALLGNLYRMGHTNVAVVAADGRSFPSDALFDRVLVDVPCSAQGTVRKKAGRLPSRSRRFLAQVTRAQEKLLRRAIELTRPGGTVLYVTCTFGPEENEAVVSRVLADAPVELEPLHPGVPHAPGVTAFEDDSFDPRLEGAVRIYPHHLDSGGMFACRLRRLDDGPRAPGAGAGDHRTDAPGREAGREGDRGWRPVPHVFPGDDPEGAARDIAAGEAILQEAWGVGPEAWAGRRWMRRGSNLWLHGCDAWPVEDWAPGGHWRLVAVGLRAMDLRGDGPPRATNDLLQWLDGAVTRRRIDFDAAGWRDLLDGRDVRVGEGHEGYAALTFGGHVIAWGFVRDGRLIHHVPGGRKKWLRSVVTEPATGKGEPG